MEDVKQKYGGIVIITGTQVLEEIRHLVVFRKSN